MQVLKEVMLPFSWSLNWFDIISIALVILFIIILIVAICINKAVVDLWRDSINKNKLLIALVCLGLPLDLNAQTISQGISWKLLSEGGIIITIILVAIPILLGMVLLVLRVKKLVGNYRKILGIDSDYVSSIDKQSEFKLNGDELSGNLKVNDNRRILTIVERKELPVIPNKKKIMPIPHLDEGLAELVRWYLLSATFWLLFGTTVGLYLGVKFVAPDIDNISWLSFGRLRPIHTNAVFWGWSSLAMLGLGYFIVPRVSNVPLAKISWGWYSLFFINTAILIGSLTLGLGINNGGGEYREYIWPIMLLFAIGIMFTFGSYYKTISKRKTQEIYISNWYILSAVIFITITAIVGYIPLWQDGLGETIVQGYYMHQAVGMWFMLFCLGIVYYFLPQELNRPIYSYSLGIMAFWTQILFYTLIGTHHFVFSALPWWIQTVAIVASAGMIIPVVAGTTNFLLTFRGAWFKIKDSYTLPFFLVGIAFYFTGSMQGTAQAFRYTNLLWHFTDFTVAHSHMTMYGIITFLLWGGIYALVPRFFGKEAPQSTIGIHFWLALIGLMLYSISLMYGGTLRGLSWMEGMPFIESVSLMMPYWLWRAIGGTLMWVSHLVFAYNLIVMFKKPVSRSIEEK